MSFRPLQPINKWSGSKAPVRCSVWVSKRGVRLKIILAMSLLQKLNCADVRRFSVLVGEGASAGRIRVIPCAKDSENAFKAAVLPHNSGVRLVLGDVPGLPGVGCPARDALHVIGSDPQSGQFIEITVPIFAVAQPAPTPRPAADPQPIGGKVAGAEMQKLRIDPTLVTLLATKAGVAFGCTRQEVFDPLDKKAMNAQAAVARWLAERGFAQVAIGKVLKLEGSDLSEAIQAAKVFSPQYEKNWERFVNLAAEAIRHAGMAA